MPNIPKYLREKHVLEAIIPPSGGVTLLDEYFHANSTLMPLTTDLSDVMGNTWTANGNAAVSNGFLEFDGTGDYLRSDNIGITQFGKSPWTIEFFLTLLTSNVGGCNLVDARSANSGLPFVLGLQGTAANNAPYIFDGGSSRNSSVGFATDVETHIAFVVDAARNLSIYTAGVRGYNAATVVTFSGDAAPTLGWSFGLGLDAHAKIRGFRITHAARYSGASFTPPSLPYPESVIE
jgi:hypothetical protein